MHEEEPNSVRRELLDKLRSVESPQSQSGLAELAYRRALEALERAQEEARNIRLRAIEDSRLTREHEMASLMESLRSLRQSAESQIETVLRAAELEAERMRDQARAESRQMIEQANAEGERTRAEGRAILAAADERRREVKRIEAGFNDMLAEVAERLGMNPKPARGWLKRLFRPER